MQDVALFALADYALLPYTVAALQVFEPSHREMIDDAQASNQLLVVAGLEPGCTVMFASRCEGALPAIALRTDEVDAWTPA